MRGIRRVPQLGPARCFGVCAGGGCVGGSCQGRRAHGPACVPAGESGFLSAASRYPSCRGAPAPRRTGALQGGRCLPASSANGANPRPRAERRVEAAFRRRRHPVRRPHGGQGGVGARLPSRTRAGVQQIPVPPGRAPPPSRERPPQPLLPSSPGTETCKLEDLSSRAVKKSLQ